MLVEYIFKSVRLRNNKREFRIIKNCFEHAYRTGSSAF